MDNPSIVNYKLDDMYIANLSKQNKFICDSCKHETSITLQRNTKYRKICLDCYNAIEERYGSHL